MKIFKHIYLLGFITFELASCVPKVTLNKSQQITGQNENSNVESFKGIPFAQPPIGNLRFAPPVPYNGSYDLLDATKFSKTCVSINPVGLLSGVNTIAQNFPFLGIFQEIIPILTNILTNVDTDEDCLYLNVYRPSGTNVNDKLPVMIWFFGGAFLFGSGGTYDGSRYVQSSMDMKQPVIVVTFNHRLGPFGFLGGDAIQKAGLSNVGLKDQRLVMKWVADHIADFGGDPSKVTLFGESAGGMSIFAHMAAYNGNIDYKRKPLFQGAIMQSGSQLPMGSITDERPQKLYERFARAAGCEPSKGGDETIACLRSKTSDELSRAQNSFGITEAFGIMDMFLSWSPRADGEFLTDIPYKLATEGKFASVPFIIGDQEDEATLFAPLFLTTTSENGMRDLVKDLLHNSTDSDIDQILSLYPQDPTQGAPFRTGRANQITPQFKRIASLLTDVLYHNSRRRVLRVSDGVPRWNYFATTLHNILPVLGTTHATDIIWQWFLNIGPHEAYKKYFISFANHLDPNIGTNLQNWPQYTNEDKKSLEIGFTSLRESVDDFREKPIQYIIDNPKVFAL